MGIADELIKDISESAEDKKDIFDLIDEALIPQGIEIPKPEIVFALNGIPLFTKKSISTLTGKAKTGKTTVTSWVISQIILQDLKCVWIDTEQGMYYASKTQYWILNMSGVYKSENLKFYDLKMFNPKQRTDMVEEILKRDEPDIIIIDGVRDLVFDINSPEEATIMTGNLMRWAEVHNCHILTIIHQNKSSDTMRGHLGTEMANKSETVMSVEKDKDNPEIIVCKPEFTRGMPFGCFALDRDESGIPRVLELFQQRVSSSMANSKKLLPVEVDKATHYEMLTISFGNEPALSYGDLQVSLCAAFEQYGMEMGVNKSKTFIQFYNQNNYITKMQKTSNRTFYKLNVQSGIGIPNAPF